MIRMHVYGVDRSQFERLLDQPLREHLLAFVDGRQDLAPEPPQGSRPSRPFAWFPEIAEDAVQIRIGRGYCVHRHFKGDRRILSREEIDAMPELAVTTRDRILMGSSHDFEILMGLFAEFTPYSCVRTLIPGYRKSLTHRLLDAFAFWYGSESIDMLQVKRLFLRITSDETEADYAADMVSRGFPPLPPLNHDMGRVDGWTTDETRLALLHLRKLLEYGEPSYEETTHMIQDDTEVWKLWVEIINKFFALDEYPEPAVVCFADMC